MSKTKSVSVPNNASLDFLEQLHVEQQTWHNTLYTSANAKLLALLAECLTAYHQLGGDRAILKVFAQKLTDLKIPYNVGTHLTSRIVRYVFRVYNSRSAAYARVLRSAIEHKVEPSGLAAWVTGLGGIENVRRLNRKNMTPAEQLIASAEEAADALLKSAALVTVSTAELAPDSSAELPFALALVRANNNAGYDIVYCVRNASLVRRALALVPRDVVAANNNVNAAQQQADKLAQSNALAAQAVASTDAAADIAA